MHGILLHISIALQRGRDHDVATLVSEALESGYSAAEILEDGLLAGMRIISNQFRQNEIYVPDVLIAARAMKAGTDLLKSCFTADHAPTAGRAVIGTVQGDLHDIGKNLVAMMLAGKGIDVVDLGVNVAAADFVEAAVAHGCQIICCSALLTTTMHALADVVKAAEQAGIRRDVVIMVGGAPVSQAYACSIGADVYAADAASAAEAAWTAIQTIKKGRHATGSHMTA